MIIVSATLDGMVGTLEEGKLADLVVVDGDQSAIPAAQDPAMV